MFKMHIIVDHLEGNKVLDSLKVAADKRGVAVNAIPSEETDFFSLPILGKGDLLYRQDTTKRSITIEQLLIREGVAHFYGSSKQILGSRGTSYFYNERAGLPVIKTIPLLPSSSLNIQKHIDYLGGFPLVLKVTGSYRGVGVMRVDSVESLKSVLDYIRSFDGLVLMRSYIPHDYYGRLVVVGGQVVASNTTCSMYDDFRTNALDNVEQNNQAVVFPDEVQKVAVEAVASQGLEFGGVDVLFANEHEYYIAEANFPCAFNYVEEHTGIDVSGAMIDFLCKKATK